MRLELNCLTPLNSMEMCSAQDPKFEYCRVSMGDNATETLQSRFEAFDHFS